MLSSRTLEEIQLAEGQQAEEKVVQEGQRQIEKKLWGILNIAVIRGVDEETIRDLVERAIVRKSRWNFVKTILRQLILFCLILFGPFLLVDSLVRYWADQLQFTNYLIYQPPQTIYQSVALLLGVALYTQVLSVFFNKTLRLRGLLLTLLPVTILGLPIGAFLGKSIGFGLSLLGI